MPSENERSGPVVSNDHAQNLAMLLDDVPGTAATSWVSRMCFAQSAPDRRRPRALNPPHTPSAGSTIESVVLTCALSDIDMCDGRFRHSTPISRGRVEMTARATAARGYSKPAGRTGTPCIGAAGRFG
jgi:hypothetical protein